MKPKLRFPGYEEEWEEKKLGEISDIVTGGTPKTSIKAYWNVKEIPWMSSGEVNNRYIMRTEKFISRKGLDSSSAKLIPIHSVLVALAGQGSTRGKVAINKIRLATNQSLAAIIPYDKILNYNFIFFNLDYRYLELRQLSTGDGGRGGLNKKIISNIIIKYPSLPEQEKIGEFFSLLDERIEKQEEKIELMKERKKGWMQKLFNQEIRFKDENGNDYPDWEEKKLGDVADIKGGYAFKSQEFSYEGVPVITISNINKFIYDNQSFNHSVLSNNQILKGKSGDILVALSGATTGKSGQIKEGNYYINQRIARIRHHHNLNSYLFNWINSNDFNKQLNKLLVAGAQPNLSIIDLKQLLIPLPSLSEQEKIANFLSTQDELIEKEEEKLNLLKEQKKGLLQQMFI